jgi:dolichol-phosphate mannosyltransferase
MGIDTVKNNMLVSKAVEFLKSRVFKFLVGGGIAALFNLLLIYSLVEYLGLDTVWLRNISNVLSIEASLVLSFFIYREWVWEDAQPIGSGVLPRQLLLYHFSAGSAFATRALIIFPVLDVLGVHYVVNTIIGISVGAIINYTISNRLVFRYYTEGVEDMFPPEGIDRQYNTSDEYRKGRERREGPHKISIVIPAYNEEDCIYETIKSISGCLKERGIPYEVLAVNDNSSDNTGEILKRCSQEDKRVRYVNNNGPNGFGHAVRTGLEEFSGDSVVIAMADGSDRPEDIVKYYQKLVEGYDCVFGSRFVEGGAVVDYPIFKLIVNRAANLFISTLFNISYNDVTNAFKAYRREVVEGIKPLVSHHFNLTVEMPLKAIARGYRCAIVPVVWTNRKQGESKLQLNEMGSRYLYVVLKVLLEKHLTKGDYVRKESFELDEERYKQKTA